MRNVIASVLIVLGLVLAVAAAAIVYPVAGLGVAAAAFVVLGVLSFDRGVL